MKFVATDDPALWTRFVDCKSPLGAVIAVVLQHDGGELGFQLNDSWSLASAFVSANAIAIVRENAPQWKGTFAGWERAFIFPHATDCIAVVASPTDEVLSQLAASDANIRKRKANEILARHKKPGQPLESTVFDHWVAPSGRVECSAMQWLMDRSGSLVFWRRTDWGFHATAFSETAERLREWLSDATHRTGCHLVEVHSIEKMPAW